MSKSRLILLPGALSCLLACGGDGRTQRLPLSGTAPAVCSGLGRHASACSPDVVIKGVSVTAKPGASAFSSDGPTNEGIGIAIALLDECRAIPTNYALINIVMPTSEAETSVVISEVDENGKAVAAENDCLAVRLHSVKWAPSLQYIEIIAVRRDSKADDDGRVGCNR